MSQHAPTACCHLRENIPRYYPPSAGKGNCTGPTPIPLCRSHMCVLGHLGRWKWSLVGGHNLASPHVDHLAPNLKPTPRLEQGTVAFPQSLHDGQFGRMSRPHLTEKLVTPRIRPHSITNNEVIHQCRSSADLCAAATKLHREH